MGVPEKIRKVERPVNTVVCDTGGSGVLRYPVRCRKGARCIPGHNPRPINGSVIGHIHPTELRFIPLSESVKRKEEKTQIKISPITHFSLIYGSAAFVHSVSQDIADDLRQVMPLDIAERVLAMAMLRVMFPQIPLNRYGTNYRRSYVHVFHPGVALSANTVMKFQQDMGEAFEWRHAFYRLRVERAKKDHHIAVDGTLKQDSSISNTLSQYSRKTRLKGGKDISILYAYDIELNEPLCARVFAGNCIDSQAYRSFIQANNIHQGILIADKGFPPNKIVEELDANSDLHFITPLKRNDKRIKTNHMLDFGPDVLAGIDAPVYYKKCAIRAGKRFLYAFKNLDMQNTEAHSLTNSIKKGNTTLTKKQFDEKTKRQGTIVFESDLDLDPVVVYKNYQDRWLIETVFRHYKRDLECDSTRVQLESSTIGSEFIDFIASIMTCRMVQKAENAGLLDKQSYGNLMEDLSTARRPEEASLTPHTDDGQWDIVTLDVFSELEALELSIPVPKPEKKKRGRPVGSKNQKTIEREKLVASMPALPKRKPGRPKGSKNKKTLERELKEKTTGLPTKMTAVKPTDQSVLTTDEKVTSGSKT